MRHKRSRRILGLAACFGGALFCAGSGAAAVDDRPPNIVLLISDDQDFEHLGFMGHPLAHTPALDSLAASGTVFPSAHVTAPRCRPSLASLLSGLWPHQHGIFFNRGPSDEATLDPALSLPRLLRDAGYATYLGGKFWEADPEDMGFTDYEIGNVFVREGQEHLFDFIDEHAGERSFFVWWSPKMPHAPHDAPQRIVDTLAPESIPIPERFDRPSWPAVDRAVYREKERQLLAMVAWFDEGVAALRAKLESVGEARRTLFVFLIDNGFANGSHSKGSPFEKGLRTPIVFSWKDEIPAGVVRESLVSSVDLYPTLLEYAGVEVPARAAGVDLRGLLAGSAEEPRDVLYGAVYPRDLGKGSRSPARSVYALHARTLKWKYVLYLKRIDRERSHAYRIYYHFAPILTRQRWEEDLFDLAEDPHELRDLATTGRHEPWKQKLREGALAWWRETGGGTLRLP